MDTKVGAELRKGEAVSLAAATSRSMGMARTELPRKTPVLPTPASAPRFTCSTWDNGTLPRNRGLRTGVFLCL